MYRILTATYSNGNNYETVECINPSNQYVASIDMKYSNRGYKMIRCIIAVKRSKGLMYA